MSLVALMGAVVMIAGFLTGVYGVRFEPEMVITLASFELSGTGAMVLSGGAAMFIGMAMFVSGVYSGWE